MIKYFQQPDEPFFVFNENAKNNIEEKGQMDIQPLADNPIDEEFENNLNLNISNEKVENMVIIDKDYQNKFGKLYKTFDVRYVKNKLWETINEV